MDPDPLTGELMGMDKVRSLFLRDLDGQDADIVKRISNAPGIIIGEFDDIGLQRRGNTAFPPPPAGGWRGLVSQSSGNCKLPMPSSSNRRREGK